VPTNQNQISFIIDNITDYEAIASEISKTQSVHVLNSKGDILSQIAFILEDYSNLDAIHLFSHGASGSLDLGNITLDNQTLQNYHEILAQISASLGDNGDILIYGCGVAEGQGGVEFISKLSQATGADIAASDDLTGANNKSGDWILEVASGAIEAPVINLLDYTGVLASSYAMDDSIDAGTDISNPSGSVTSGTAGNVTFTVTSNTTGGNLYVNGNQVSVSYTVTGYENGDIDYEIRDLAGTVAGSYSLAFDIDYDADSGVEWNDTINLTVNAVVPPNTAPNAGNGNATFAEGTSGAVTLSTSNTNANDSDGSIASFSPATINYTITNNASLKGTHTISTNSYTVTDDDGTTSAGSGTFTIYGTYVDDPTTWGTAPSNQTWAASGTNSFNFGSGASDPDDSVNYSYISGAPSWMSASGSTISGNIAPQYAGQTFTINVRATGSTSVDKSFTITIGDAASVNDTPTSAGGSKSVNEDVTMTFSSADFAFADLDNSAGGSSALGAALASIKIASLPTNGTLKLSSVNVTQNQVISTADISNLTFIPTADYNGSDSFTYYVNDGIADSSSAATMSITVSPINDAPVLSGTGNDMMMITENATSDAGQTVSAMLATQTDPDNPIGSDVHGANNGLLQGIAIYSTTVNGPSTGGKWQYKVDSGSWTDIGVVAEGSALLLKSSDTIRFVPDAKNGQTASFDYYAWDQSGGTTAGTKVNVATRGDTTPYSTASDGTSITIDDVNDAPTIATPIAQTVYEDNPLTIATLSFDDVDINHANRDDSNTANDIVEVTLSVAHGVLTLNDPAGNNITISSGANGSSASLTFQGTLADVNAAVNGLIYTPDLNYNRYIGDTDANDVLNISISDLENVEGIGDAGSTALVTTSSFNITVNPVNDAPILENNGTSVPALTTITENIGDDNGADGNDGNTASLNDGDDDATANSNNGGNLISDLIRAVGGTTDATGITNKSFASDVDFFTGGTSNGNPNEAQDHGVAIYGLSNDGPADGGVWQFSTNSGTTWTAINTEQVNGGTTALLLTSTDKIRFVPDTDNGTTATISYYLWDGLIGNTTGQHGTYVSVATRGGTTNYSTAGDIATIVVTDINDNPILDLDGSNASSVSTSYTNTFLPRGTEVQVVDSDMTITDVDKSHRTDASAKDTITQATISITGGALDNLFGTTYETLSAKTAAGGSVVTTYAGTLGNLTFSGNSTTTLTISGVGTWADYEAALKKVYYNNANENAFSGNRTITVSVKDGGDTTTVADGINEADKLDSNSATTTILIPWAPVIDLDGTASSGRNNTATFTEGVGSATGTAVAIAKSDASITDQDGNLKSLTVTLNNYPDSTDESLAVDGSLVTTLSGLGITTAYSNNNHTVTFTGTVDATYFQLALRGVKYVNASQNPDVTTRTLTVSAVDANDNPSVNATTTIGIIPVNDAPVVGGDLAATQYEGSLYIVTNTDLNPSDVDDAETTLNYIITTTTTNGTMFKDLNGNGEIDSGEAFTASSEFTQAQVEAGLIKYRHNGDESTSDTFVFRLEDGMEDSITAPTSSMTFTINAINDAPTLSATSSNPSFAEGDTAVTLFSDSAISGVDTRATDTVSSLTLSVSGLADGSDEKLTIDGSTISLTDTTGTTTTNSMSYTVSVSGSTATVTITKAGGIATTAAQTLVDALAYSNTSENPTTGSRTLTLTQIKDNGGDANGGEDTTALSIASTVTVSAVNDDPTGHVAITGTVAQGETLTANTGGIADNDGLGSFSYIWKSSSDGTTWNAIIGATASTYVLTSSDVGKYIHVAVSYTDGGGTAETLTSWQAGAGDGSSNGTAVVDTNDAPILSATGANPTAIDASAALFSSTAVDTVEDGQTITQIVMTVSGLADGANEILKVAGTEVVLTNATSGTTATGSIGYAVSVTGTTATVTLTHAGLSEEETQTLIDALAYKNGSLAPAAGSRVVTISSITDNGGGSATATTSIASTVVISASTNTAPTLSGDNAFSVNEGDVYTVVVDDMAATDSRQSADSLLFTIGTAPINGTLFLDANGNGAADNGETLIASNTFLQSALTSGKIKYRHDASETTTDSFIFSTSDGSLATDSATVTITVDPINDAPSLSATGANPTTIDGSAALFSSAAVDTVEDAQSVTELVVTVSGLADEADEKLKINGVDVVLQDAAITANGFSYAVSVTDSIATVTITHAGLTEEQTKTFIEALAYQNSAETPTNGVRQATLTGITDSGGGSDTTILSIASTVNITTGSGDTITNTAPTVGTNTGFTLNEGAVGTIDAAKLAATDTEQSSGSLTFAVTNATDNGTLFRDINANGAVDSGEALGLGAIFQQIDITNNKIKYLHNGGETTSDSFDFTVSDGLLPTDSATFDITVTAVNDAPTLSATGANLAVLDGSSSLFASSAVDTIEADDTVTQLTLTVSNLADGAKQALK